MTREEMEELAEIVADKLCKRMADALSRTAKNMDAPSIAQFDIPMRFLAWSLRPSLDEGEQQ